MVHLFKCVCRSYNFANCATYFVLFVIFRFGLYKAINLFLF